MNNTIRQIFNLERLFKCILLVIVPSLVIYGVSVATMTSLGFKVVEILRDPAQQTGYSSFLGFVSTINVWMWISAASIGFFAILTQDFSALKSRKELLLLTAALSAMLGIDDFFLIHDRYVNQLYCYGAYAVCALALLARHFKTIVAIDGFTFLLAGSLLAASILSDLLQPYFTMNYEHLQILEEGLKFAGTAAWLYFTGRAAAFGGAATARPRAA